MIHNFKTTINVTDQKILEVLEKFPSKPNTLDNSNDSNFNNSSENFMRPNSVEQIQVAMSNTLLGNYSTKKMCVLIINQQNFVRTTNADLQKMLPDHNLTERKGTIKDREALQSLFESFNYHVTTKNDLTHIEVLREVDKITKQSSEYDGLIVCVLSHGHEQIFYGSDSVPIFIRDVKEIMSSKLLLHKPKILLIQACQGTSLQRSVRRIVPSTENDGPSTSSLISGSTRADFLIFWSTIEGFASVRHIDQGSWFIQELVKRIRETYRTTNLLDICTAVIREVSLRRGYRDECMLPKLESTFTQNFRFPTD
ncbi:hypothetical protein PVAND_001230 [Polypedilum vanderplanki]|nr:hypothetical protein PVAND_001230 [Polypedilum vanderplanki]